ncbi:hypothetical protein H6F93_10655 [Leptolyngbya sp. FACHB-671]|nr:hypothetical protein [Leptolyngbya sp. FACHB-671]MBD2067979.1 hypothetical protein [Leptolyngbya sp. FACHB-671]
MLRVWHLFDVDAHMKLIERSPNPFNFNNPDLRRDEQKQQQPASVV